MALPGAYIINRTDPTSGSFTINPNTTNGPVSPTQYLPYTGENGPATGINTSLVFYGKGVPGYGERIAEDFVNMLENFSGPKAPVAPIHGQLWLSTGHSFQIISNTTQTITINGNHVATFDPTFPFKTVAPNIANSTNDTVQLGNWTTDFSTFTGVNTTIQVNETIAGTLPSGSYITIEAAEGNHRLKIYDAVKAAWISATPIAYTGSGPGVGDVPSLGDMWFQTGAPLSTIRVYDGVAWADIIDVSNYLDLTLGGTVTGPVIFNDNVTFNDPVAFTDSVVFSGLVTHNGQTIFNDPIIANSTATFNGVLTSNNPAVFNDVTTFNDPVTFNDSAIFDGPIFSTDGVLNFNSNVIDNLISPVFAYPSSPFDANKAVNVDYVNDAVAYAIANGGGGSGFVLKTGDMMSGDLKFESPNNINNSNGPLDKGIQWIDEFETHDPFYRIFIDTTDSVFGKRGLVFSNEYGSSDDNFIFRHQLATPTIDVFTINYDTVVSNVPVMLPADPTVPDEASNKRYVDILRTDFENFTAGYLPPRDDTYVSTAVFDAPSNSVIISQGINPSLPLPPDPIAIDLSLIQTEAEFCNFVPMPLDNSAFTGIDLPMSVATALSALDVQKADLQLTHTSPIYSITNTNTIDIDADVHPEALVHLRAGHTIEIVNGMYLSSDNKQYVIASRQYIAGTPNKVRLIVTNTDGSPAVLFNSSGNVGRQALYCDKIGFDVIEAGGLGPAPTCTSINFDSATSRITLTGADSFNVDAAVGMPIFVRNTTSNNTPGDPFYIVDVVSNKIVEVDGPLVNETSVTAALRIPTGPGGFNAAEFLRDDRDGLFGGASCKYRTWFILDGVPTTTPLTVTGADLVTYIDYILEMESVPGVSNGYVNTTRGNPNFDTLVFDSFVGPSTSLIFRDDDPSRTGKCYTYALDPTPTAQIELTDLTSCVGVTNYGFTLSFELDDGSVVANWCSFPGSSIPTIADVIDAVNAHYAGDATMEIVPESDQPDVYQLYGFKITSDSGLPLMIGAPFFGTTDLFAHLGLTEWVAPVTLQIDRFVGLSRTQAEYATPRGVDSSSGLIETGKKGTVDSDIATVGYVSWAVHNARHDNAAPPAFSSNEIYPPITTIQDPTYTINYIINNNEFEMYGSGSYQMHVPITVDGEQLIASTSEYSYAEAAAFKITALSRTTNVSTLTLEKPHGLPIGTTFKSGCVKEVTASFVVNPSNWSGVGTTMTVTSEDQITYPNSGADAVATLNTDAVFTHSIGGYPGNCVRLYGSNTWSRVSLKVSGRRFPIDRYTV